MSNEEQISDMEISPVAVAQLCPVVYDIQEGFEVFADDYHPPTMLEDVGKELSEAVQNEDPLWVGSKVKEILRKYKIYYEQKSNN